MYLKSITTKLIIYMAIIALSGVTQVNASTIDELVRKKNELQRKEQQNKKLLEQKKKETTSLQGTIERLDDDISYTENRISNTQSQLELSNSIIEQLNRQIGENEQELESFTQKMNNAYVNLYILSQTSPLEMMLHSESLTDVVSFNQYIQSIQDSIQKDIDKTQEMRSQLDAKRLEKESERNSLESIKNNLAVSRSNLDRQKQEKNSLLRVTQGDEARYANLLEQVKREQTAVDSELRRLLEISARNSTNIVTGGTGGYPYANLGISSRADPWLFLVRQCTSYAAWRWNSWGIYWHNTQPGRGHAKYWPEIARTLGYSTGSSPSARAIISWPWGAYGHVAIVERVLADGSIVISEYNAVPAFGGLYSERTISPGNYAGATFIYAP